MFLCCPFNSVDNVCELLAGIVVIVFISVVIIFSPYPCYATSIPDFENERHKARCLPIYLFGLHWIQAHS